MAEPLWTSAEISAATGGAAHGTFSAVGVTFDSREVSPGDLFVALPGVRDGHDFVPAAMAAGAAGALTARPTGEGLQVLVPDTLCALEALGAAARDRASARRAAVTGSVGKTSVTQAIAASLRLAGPSHNSVKSFNNHIGVPLTLARMPRRTERAVFEIGMNHAGEIGPLSRLVRPHVAVVTNVGPVHTENFADGEAGVARAKAEIFEGLEPGGAAVIPADGPWAAFLREAAEAAGARVLTFGAAAAAQARLLSPSMGERPGEGVEARRVMEGSGDVSEADLQGRGSTPIPGPSPIQGEGGFRVVLHDQELTVRVGQPGAHWGVNAAAILLACGELGVPVETTLQALASFGALAGRGAEAVVPIPGGAFTLVDESYNANPISMRSAFDTLSRRPGRRVVVLTDMLELGPEGERLHAELAAPVEAAGTALAFSAGPLMRAFHEALPPSLRGAWAPSAAELAPLVAAAVRPGDVVVVKGSNGSKASLVAGALRALGGEGTA